MDPLGKELLEVFESFRKLNLSAMLPVSHCDFCILKVIETCHEEQKEEVRVASVIEKLHMPPPSVSRSMKSLEERGLIIRSTNPKDRRHVHISLTDAGKELLKEADTTFQDFSEAVFSRIDRKSLQDMIHLMKNLNGIMSEEVERRRFREREK